MATFQTPMPSMSRSYDMGAPRIRPAAAGSVWRISLAARSGFSCAISRRAICVLSAAICRLPRFLHDSHLHRRALSELARVIVGPDVLAPVHGHGHPGSDSPCGLGSLL